MSKVFSEVDRFFSTFENYLGYNAYFIIFGVLFLLTSLLIAITTSHSYEVKLIKAIDMFNTYFGSNPQINEDNLINFNNKMKSKKVPKQLRKQWQQYVLYREEKASKYMSFENCVSTPIRNSTYTRDVSILNILSYVYAGLCFLLNLYCSYEEKLVEILQHCLLCPIIILTLNYLFTILFKIRHNAIISDINSNYQYFEVYIDKATETIPEYVDYEALFDKKEIRDGIPILSAYLQKRAEEEKKELERARLRNVEHEKFNFDEAGVERSLVLERAMTEAENYIAERKKLMQDMEQINSEIYQEENSFRETTKEYQRQMQVSKESFENFKQQLEEVTSSIEANYLKKQQQQELDRQRNLERDYDTATDRHKKVLETYQAEITDVENQIKKARNVLEKSMMSEFDTYSNKVYAEASRVIEKRDSEKFTKAQNNIKSLVERLQNKENEVDNLNTENEKLKEQLSAVDPNYVPTNDQPQANNKSGTIEQNAETGYTTTQQNTLAEAQPADVENWFDELDNTAEPQQATADNATEQTNTQPTYTFNYLDEEPVETSTEEAHVDSEGTEQANDEPKEEYHFNDLDGLEPDNSTEQNAQPTETEPVEKEQAETGEAVETKKEEIPTEPTEQTEQPSTEEDFDFDDDFDEDEDEGEIKDLDLTDEKPESLDDSLTGLPQDDDAESDINPLDKFASLLGDSDEEQVSTVQKEESKPAGKRGRPRKVVTEAPAKKQVGRPRKVQTEAEQAKPAGKRGRPRKDETNSNEQTLTKAKRGRPKKDDKEASPVKKRAGRPRKVQGKSSQVKSSTKRGRPKKDEVKAKRGRPKKENYQASPIKKRAGRPRKVEISAEQTKPTGKRGRPKKEQTEQPKTAEINEIDKFLKEIDKEIAKENAKLEASKKELEKNSKIKDKK